MCTPLKDYPPLVRESIDHPVLKHIIGFDIKPLQVSRVFDDVNKLFFRQNSTQEMKLRKFFAVKYPEFLRTVVIELCCMKHYSREKTSAFCEQMYGHRKLR